MESPHRNQPVVSSGRDLQSASGALILLHGRGASAEDILSLGDELGSAEFAYLAPQAAGHTWYPHSFLSPLESNEPWLSSALELVGNIVERAIAAGTASDRIFIAGFSQGACLATEFVARNAKKYGGLIAFTGGLLGPEKTKFRYSGDLQGMPCFLGSGDPDPHVPWWRVKESAEELTKLGGTVTLRHYPGMPHTIREDEIAEARKILRLSGK